jgi:uncharacterized NAD(P)/FAD-binding protein YdhS
VRDLSTAPETTAIVGGGASGVLAAVHLARLSRKPRRIILIDPAAELGAGAAFSTDNPQHVLNAPARMMSAFDDDPDHFVRWGAALDLSFRPDDFVPRRLYRLYLQDLLAQTRRQKPGGSTISWIRERVVDMHPVGDGDDRALVLRSGSGLICTARCTILAIGAPDPSVLAGFGLGGPLAVINPWTPGALDGVPSDSHVFIVGTGLTTVDVALSLADGRRSTMHARSRRGAVPAVHREDGFVAWPELDFSDVTSAAGLVRRFHSALRDADASGWGWRNVVSAAREALPPVWERLPDEEKLRFLRHAGRSWEVHRHRMSPHVDRAFCQVLSAGLLTIGPGRLVDVEERPRHRHSRFIVAVDSGRCRERLEVGALIDCSGPSSSSPGRIPLLHRLLSGGLAEADPIGRGLAVNGAGAVLASEKRDSGLLYSVGWVRSGRCFESMAVPALRKQAAQLAEYLNRPARARGGEPADAARVRRTAVMPVRSVA